MVDVLPPHTPYPRWEVTGTATEGYITINVMQSGNIDVKQEYKLGDNTLLKTLQAISTYVKQEPSSDPDSMETSMSTQHTAPPPAATATTSAASTAPSATDFDECSKMSLSSSRTDNMNISSPSKVESISKVIHQIKINLVKRSNETKEVESELCVGEIQCEIKRENDEWEIEFDETEIEDNTELEDIKRDVEKMSENVAEPSTAGWSNIVKKSIKNKTKKAKLTTSDSVKTIGASSDEVSTEINNRWEKEKNVDTTTEAGSEPVGDAAGKERLRCEQCGKSFSKNKNFLRHIKSHRVGEELKCEICQQEFDTKEELQEHRETHEDTKHFWCDFCGKMFNRKDNLLRHRNTHIDKKEHKCAVCDRGFSTHFSLKMHMKLHEGEKARVFSCEYCDKSFYRRGCLMEHIQRCLNLKTYKCDLCDKAFNNISGLNSHAAVHQAAKEFTCELCGKAFKRLINMKNHMRVHLNEKQYKCTICGKGCNTSSQLAMHKKMHTTETNYSCEICGKVFKYRHSWKNHTATHTDEKKYECNLCGKKYHSSSVLCSHRKYCNDNGQECAICHEVIIGGKMCFKRHMKTHPLEFPCETCAKTFKRKDILKRHMEIHLNERRYQCTLCDKSFNTSSQLGMHKTKVHKTRGKAGNSRDLSFSGNSISCVNALNNRVNLTENLSREETDGTIPEDQQRVVTAPDGRIVSEGNTGSAQEIMDQQS